MTTTKKKPPPPQNPPMLKAGDKVTVTSEHWKWKPHLPHLEGRTVKSTHRYRRWVKVTLDNGKSFDQMSNGQLPASVRLYSPEHDVESALVDAKRDAAERVDAVLDMNSTQRRLLLAFTTEELHAIADRLKAAAEAKANG